MKIRTITAVGVLALALAACGGSGDDEKASENLAASIMDSNDETFKVTQDEADCVSEGMVEEIGTDQLVEYKILTEDLEASEDGIESVEMSEDDAQAAADTMQDCADIKKIFTGAMSELPEEAQACVEEKLTDDVVNEFLVSVFRNDAEGGQQNLMTALTECLQAGG